MTTSQHIPQTTAHLSRITLQNSKRGHSQSRLGPNRTHSVLRQVDARGGAGGPGVLGQVDVSGGWEAIQRSKINLRP
ncbi:hypothetical protein TWF718_007863 [Orbilia javanica]|uniref:Uncharacterized protein n=1 Tax=Orbilia javanica TaxID=47235 RepID=A0AAN8RH80_9PEZI